MKKNLAILSATLSIVVLSVLTTDARICAARSAVNTWFLITAHQTFYVPPESDIASFNPVVMNEGSGEWWIYGEDKNFAYHIHPESIDMYYMVPKESLESDSIPLTDFSRWPSGSLSLKKRGP